jgi:hypothetical protein
VLSLPSLTARDVQLQIDNNTPGWLGKFETMLFSAMDQRVHNFLASAISPLQADVKALHSQAVGADTRQECWTEKMAYNMDVQGKKTFELGCEMKKMGDRMAAMERAAGLPPPCQSRLWTLFLVSTQASAETAELTTSSEQRLARVEDSGQFEHASIQPLIH